MDKGELSWNDEINDLEGKGFTVLPAGVYPFEVRGFERARFKGSAKLPACNQAKLTLVVGDPSNQATINHNLFLHEKTMGFLCEFFRSIGQRKHGQACTMDWGKVPGSTGRCKVGIRTFTGDDKEERQMNEIKKFLDPEETEPVQAAEASTTKKPDDLPF